MADGYVPLTAEKLKSDDGVRLLNTMLESLFKLVAGDGNTVGYFTGFGSPEGAVVAGIGALYLRKDGSTSTTLYVKTSGTGATGWTAK
jgi:hypothetical protein